MRRLAIWVLCAVVSVAACDKAEEPARPEGSAKESPAKDKPAGSAAAKATGSAKTVEPKPTGSAAGSGGGDAAAIVAGIAASVGAPNVPPESTTPAFKVGDRVYGMWTNGRFYPGRIAKANPDGTFQVNYDDGDVSKSLPIAKIKAVVAPTTPAGDGTYKVGDTVFGMWTNGSWYPGRIAAVNADGTFRVNYNDGDVSPALPVSKIKPRKASATGTTGTSTSTPSDAPCPGPGITRRCNGVCVNIQENNNHCGGCNNRCADGKHCDGHLFCRDANGDL